MRHIAKLEAIPRDGEFKFRARAQSLVDTWAKMASGPTGTNGTKPKSVKAESKEADSKDSADMEIDAPGEPDAESEKVNGVTDALADVEPAAEAAEPVVDAAATSVTLESEAPAVAA